jgi:hypothetical protein
MRKDGELCWSKQQAEGGESGGERQLEEVSNRAILSCQHQASLRPNFTAAREGELGPYGLIQD